MNDDVTKNPHSPQTYTLLEALAILAPVIQKVIPIDTMVGITDQTKFIAYSPGEKVAIPGDIVGMDIPAQDAIYQAIRTQRLVAMEIPEEAFGFHFKSSAVPVFDEKGQVVGGIGLGVSLVNQKRLTEAAHQIASSAEQLIAVTEEMASSAVELTGIVEKISGIQQQIMQESEKTEEMLNLINQIANTSKMLGLNAAIEAARAGDAGRGFNVVADEIRKLADNSTLAVKQVRGIITSIQDDIKQAAGRIGSTVEFAERQAAMAEEIAATVQEFAKNSALVEEISKII